MTKMQGTGKQEPEETANLQGKSAVSTLFSHTVSPGIRRASIGS